MPADAVIQLQPSDGYYRPTANIRRIWNSPFEGPLSRPTAVRAGLYVDPEYALQTLGFRLMAACRCDAILTPSPRACRAWRYRRFDAAFTAST
jgi:hypothetical protein